MVEFRKAWQRVFDHHQVPEQQQAAESHDAPDDRVEPIIDRDPGDETDLPSLR